MSSAADPRGLVLVIGASGGLGGAFVEAAAQRWPQAEVMALSRQSTPALDLLDEASLRVCAQAVQARLHETGRSLDLVIDATGWLHGNGWMPEKSWRQLDPAHLAHQFAVNATGPALLMKHFLPLLPRQQRAVFATLSAKVGSIGDNRLGGWWGYRAAKAALNQFVRTAAIELARSHPQAICVALHPGTVDTALSQPFSHTGLTVRSPAEAAERLLAVIDGLGTGHTGGFLDHTGEPLPW
ncbi:SDR family NAD(P)-dependent oxidoreductase [Aquabacterium parvum]|jgi:NAD(P)-dependent dehydrogenase (short-subunit alcohol dehydrogenase family)|uniref:SDR family NAD(P)-dependent oxidoreductase n=1 Tax=Aquabacterium parvum TaxID=70584 RepID=UPI000718E27C|nr:SDR family NAD(P)-dependent oxidoreductase [Aquabacterium parvum]